MILLCKAFAKVKRRGEEERIKKRRLKGFDFCTDVTKRRETKMEEQKKIYIGNLEYGVTEADLRKVLEEKGISVDEIKLISDRATGRPKGFGFAEFATEEAAQQAIDALNDYDLNGRKLKVNKAQKMKPRTNNFGGGGSGGGGGYNKGSRY